MIPAFSTLGCPDAHLDDVVDLAARHGIGAVELRALASTTELPAYLEKTYGSPAALVACMQAKNVRVVALDTAFSLAKAGTEDRAQLLRFVPWAEALGVRWLRVFDGGFPEDEATSDAIAASWDWWQAIRAEQRWTVDAMIETHDSLITTPSILRFLARCPSASLLWDSHHTWKKGGEDPVSTWNAIKDRVVHIHVKDSISTPSPRHPFTYVRPGEGEFPAGALLQRLRAEFSGVVSLEWERLWHPYLPPLTEALASARHHRWW